MVGWFYQEEVFEKVAFREGALVGERFESCFSPVATHPAVPDTTERESGVRRLLDGVIETN